MGGDERHGAFAVMRQGMTFPYDRLTFYPVRCLQGRYPAPGDYLPGCQELPRQIVRRHPTSTRGLFVVVRCGRVPARCHSARVRQPRHGCISQPTAQGSSGPHHVVHPSGAHTYVVPILHQGAVPHRDFTSRFIEFPDMAIKVSCPPVDNFFDCLAPQNGWWRDGNCGRGRGDCRE